jgi:hypothetical protein
MCVMHIPLLTIGAQAGQLWPLVRVPIGRHSELGRKAAQCDAEGGSLNLNFGCRLKRKSAAVLFEADQDCQNRATPTKGEESRKYALALARLGDLLPKHPGCLARVHSAIGAPWVRSAGLQPCAVGFSIINPASSFSASKTSFGKEIPITKLQLIELTNCGTSH